MKVKKRTWRIRHRELGLRQCYSNQIRSWKLGVKRRIKLNFRERSPLKGSKSWTDYFKILISFEEWKVSKEINIRANYETFLTNC